MRQNPYLKQYKTNIVETASREELFLMLFDALIRFLTKAKEAMEVMDIEKIHNNITKALNILYEFVNTLDFTLNPELAENLKRLYKYHIQLLLKANIKKDKAALDEVYHLLYDMRETWRKAVNIYKTQKNDLSDEDSSVISDAAEEQSNG